MNIDEQLAEAAKSFDTSKYGDGITIRPYMQNSSLLIEVSGREFGDDDQDDFLKIVENAKICIREYFEKKGWAIP